jgi:hypothetical protein
MEPGDLPHVTADGHRYGNVGPLDNLEIDRVERRDVHDPGHEDLPKGDRL